MLVNLYANEVRILIKVLLNPDFVLKKKHIARIARGLQAEYLNNEFFDYDDIVREEEWLDKEWEKFYKANPDLRKED